MMDANLFKYVVFAGGGNRCLWQCGFWKETGEALGWRPRAFAGVSAGATMAAGILSGRMDYGLEYMKNAMSGNPSNFYWKNIFGPEPAFPHFEIYHKALLDIFTDDAMNKLKSGPDLRVLLARPPWFTGPRSAVLFGFLCYMIEKKVRHPVHAELAGMAGFKPEVVSAKNCSDAEELARLLISSSCTPPVVPVMKWSGRVVLDGGLVDNVPVKALEKEDGPILVLLTRCYPPERLPKIRGRIYVQPSEPIGVSKWDYTSPEGLQAAYDLGRRDGERFASVCNSL